LREVEYEARFLIHSVIHPAFAPGAGSAFPPPVYLGQVLQPISARSPRVQEYGTSS
jgi:hypothetical protein